MSRYSLNEPHRYERPTRISWLTLGGVWALVFMLVWGAVRSGRTEPLHNPDYKAQPVEPREGLTAEEQSTIQVFKNAAPAVCYITTIERRRSVFSLNVMEVPRGTGSGFMYDKEGHVVTNFHVIAEALANRGGAIVVTTADQRTYEADVVGFEIDKDLAVLKIEAEEAHLKPLPMGTSSDLEVGQRVLAIGNPFGLDQTLTTGVVSAVGRQIESVSGRKIRDVIQTDAAINPGNSGGPLLDSAGRLIGVNTQIASPSGASAGIGFAVPVDIVNEIVPDLIRYGAVRKPVLGVVLAEDRLSQHLRLPGLLIETVTPGSGADDAGLRGTIVDQYGRVRQLGDVIVGINDTKISGNNQLKDILEQFPVGTKVTVHYLRDDGLKKTEVELRYNQ